jgi:hypothetical protein
MSNINEKVLNILEKLEKQVKTSKEALEKYKDKNFESPQMQNVWITDVLNEHTYLQNIVTELKKSLNSWVNEQMKKKNNLT